MGTEPKNNKKTKQQLEQLKKKTEEAKKSIEKVKAEKTPKKKVVKVITEVIKQIPKEKKIKKGFFFITPKGGGISNEKTGLEKEGRKITLGLGKLSISKKGKEHEVKYGPHKVTKEGKNIGVTLGKLKYKQGEDSKSLETIGKNLRAKVYKTNGDSGFYVGYTKKFKKGGLVSKRTFIARGCGKVMNNRRKKTKIY